MSYYVKKQVSSWCGKNVSHDATQNKFIFDALLRFKAGFLVTHQKRLYLMHFYKEKPVFSWRTKKCQFVALLRGKVGYLMTQPKTKYKFDALLRFEAGFTMTRLNPLFDALLHGKSGFLMTCH